MRKKFHQIQGIQDESVSKAPKYFEESVILANEEHLSVKWLVVSKSSRDGFQTRTFHSKCDTKGPTFTIVKSGNYIFGGFKNSFKTIFKGVLGLLRLDALFLCFSYGTGNRKQVTTYQFYIQEMSL